MTTGQQSNNITGVSPPCICCPFMLRSPMSKAHRMRYEKRPLDLRIVIHHPLNHKSTSLRYRHLSKLKPNRVLTVTRKNRLQPVSRKTEAELLWAFVVRLFFGLFVTGYYLLHLKLVCTHLKYCTITNNVQLHNNCTSNTSKTFNCTQRCIRYAQ